MQKKIISTDKAPKAIGPYSQAVEVNGMLFISGQLPVDPENDTIVAGGIEEQTEQVMKNIGAILATEGYSFDNVVKSTCLLADMTHFAGMNKVYARYYPSAAPARVTFAVKELPMKALVEIETIAAK